MLNSIWHLSFLTLFFYGKVDVLIKKKKQTSRSRKDQLFKIGYKQNLYKETLSVGKNTLRN